MTNFPKRKTRQILLTCEVQLGEKAVNAYHTTGLLYPWENSQWESSRKDFQSDKKMPSVICLAAAFGLSTRYQAQFSH